MCASEYWNADQRRATVEGGAKSLSGSSYYISSPLSISTVDAIETLNVISGGEDIPAATIGVDGTSSVRVRALAGITSSSYLTVGGETTVRNVHVEAPLSSADQLLSFEGDSRWKASHGIQDRTSKGKASFKFKPILEVQLKVTPHPDLIKGGSKQIKVSTYFHYGGCGQGGRQGGLLHDPGLLPKMTPRLGLQISFYNSQKHLKATNKLEMRVMNWDPLRRGHGVMVFLLYVSESIYSSIKS
ncbi:hypothetical protein HAX54_019559 [Datura stramonium]|uniref:Uncharacterized protein n=1 Tax=Datura stramonium TaxID=4076 RepID=A0ABS8UQZ9_DATST|nr:hypothetical protein [Datura stramonium]